MDYLEMMRRDRFIDVTYAEKVWNLCGKECDGYITGVLEGVSGEGAWYTSLSAHNAKEKHLRYFARLTSDEYERARRLITNRYDGSPEIVFHD